METPLKKFKRSTVYILIYWSKLYFTNITMLCVWKLVQPLLVTNKTTILSKYDMGTKSKLLKLTPSTPIG